MEESKETTSETTKNKNSTTLKEHAKKIREKSRKTASEFKKFAFKGNIIDLAIAVIIGAAFGKIITSLVGDLIMPSIGILIGDVDFSQLKIILKDAIVDPVTLETTTPETAIRYGAFIQTIIEFFIIAISIFIMFKVIMKIKVRAERRKAQLPPPPPPPLTKTEQLLTDIKELLKNEKIQN